MNLDFLSPSAGAVLRSPMERQARAAGATFEQRSGWNVAVRYDGLEAERERASSSAGFADLSHLGKVELQAPAGALEAIAGVSLELGTATREGGTWWLPYTPTRAIAVCEPEELAAVRTRVQDAAGGQDGLTSVIDVTTAFGAMAIGGPLAREVFARFTAVDLRDGVTPVRGFRPVSVARGPGAVLREAEGRWLMLFGAALGQYMWTVVADAAGSLGGGPVATDALEQVEAREEAAPRA
jgi:glycine cleavage system aminomethyltransferase T